MRLQLILLFCFIFSMLLAFFLGVVNNGSQSTIQSKHEENHGNSKILFYNIKTATNMSHNMVVTIFTLIGMEGSGHHLYESIIHKMKRIVDESKIHNIKIIDKYAHLGFCKQLTSKHLHEIIQMTHFYQNESDIDHLLFAVTMRLSYPCGIQSKVKNNFYPNMTNLMNIVEYTNRKYNVNFNLRYIVLKREWISCVISSCIHRHRHGGCKENSKNQFHGKVLIEQQLQTIPKTYWIIIDFHDFTHRKYEYVDIISEWLNINNTELVSKSFSVIKSKKGINNSENNAWISAYLYDQQGNNANEFNLTEYMIQMFYTSKTNNSIWNKYTYVP
eukprot:173276_1